MMTVLELANGFKRQITSMEQGMTNFMEGNP